MRRECRERIPQHRFQRKPLVSDPGMYHGTCVTHVPWWRHVRHARAVMHVGIANLRWRGKCSRHSLRMRNPQFYVSGMRPITWFQHSDTNPIPKIHCVFLSGLLSKGLYTLNGKMSYQQIPQILNAWRPRHWPPFSKRHFQTHFREWLYIDFDGNFTEIHYQWSNSQYPSNNWDNGLPPTRRQDIIRISDDYFTDAYLRHSVSNS